MSFCGERGRPHSGQHHKGHQESRFLSANAVILGDVPQLAAIRPKGEGDLHIGILRGPPAVDGVVFEEALYLFSMDAKLRCNLIIT